jgi:hypothetical protein
MIAKENQPELQTALARLFADPPPLSSDCLEAVTITATGHRRLETRTLERSTALAGE